MRYTVEIDSDLKIPLRLKVAHEGTNVKTWLSNLLREVLEAEIKERQQREEQEAA